MTLTAYFKCENCGKFIEEDKSVIVVGSINRITDGRISSLYCSTECLLADEQIVKQLRKVNEDDSN